MNAKLAATPAINVTEAPDAASAVARPSLSLRCPTFPLEKAAFTELAMTIAEEIATLGRSQSPMGIDVPLKHAGLNSRSLALLQSWLKSAHDYDASMNRLMEDDTTAEVLAADILILASSRNRKAQTLPVPIKQVGSGSFASRRGARKAPRAPISVDVTTGPDEVPLTSAAVRQYVADIGMVPFDSWSNRKSGLMYGLLAMGLVGTPMTSTPTSHNPVKSPAVPSSFSSSMRLRPIAPLEDPRAVMPMRTPIFTSFLDSVRMPGVDYVQSPWIPDHHYASIDGMFAELRFPQTPRSFSGTSV